MAWRGGRAGRSAVRSCTGSRDTGCRGRGKTPWRRPDNERSWPWQGINGHTTTRTRWNSLYTSYTACSWRCCGPGSSETRRNASCSPWSSAKRPRSSTPGISSSPLSRGRIKHNYLRWGSCPEIGNGGRTSNRPSYGGSQSFSGCHVTTTCPRVQVSLLELALDFESYTRRPLPPTPQTRFVGGEMSLHEKGRVLRLAVSVLGKAAGRESILLVDFTNRCHSLVPLGAGTTAGVKGKPVFTRPAAVWHHLCCLQQYIAARWAQQQQARVARQQSKRKRAQGKQAKPALAQQPTKAKCPGKGGAKRSAGACTIDFYAVIPPGARRGPQYCVTEEADIPAEPACSDRAVLFTPPQKCTVARRPEQGPRLPRLWVCAAHQHRQCASCAAVGRGVRHCCARGHAGHPRPSVAPRGQQQGARRAEAHPPGAGGTPSAKRRRRQRALALGPDRVRPHKRGRADATPPPPWDELLNRPRAEAPPNIGRLDRWR